MFEDIKEKNLKDQIFSPGPNTAGDESNIPKTVPQHPTVSKPEVGKVEDMFASTDNKSEGLSMPEKPAVFQPKEAATSAENTSTEEDESKGNSFNLKKYLKLGGIGLVVIVVLSGSWYGYNSFFKANAPSEIINTNDEIVDEGIVDNNNFDEVINDDVFIPFTNDIIEDQKDESVQILDSDQDGLTDAEEKQLGMNINNVDTDDDGLFDREEVKVYKTDPLNADSDGDGYLDGAEVDNGYNPLGSGLLYEIN